MGRDERRQEEGDGWGGMRGGGMEWRGEERRIEGNNKEDWRE